MGQEYESLKIYVGQLDTKINIMQDIINEAINIIHHSHNNIDETYKFDALLQEFNKLN